MKRIQIHIVVYMFVLQFECGRSNTKNIKSDIIKIKLNIQNIPKNGEFKI